MKKYCIIFLTLVIITLTALGFSGVFPSATVGAENEYLRIHIRADSNDGSAQAVKYLVRDDVVDYLTPLVAEYETKEKPSKGCGRIYLKSRRWRRGRWKETVSSTGQRRN